MYAVITAVTRGLLSSAEYSQHWQMEEEVVAANGQQGAHA